MEAATLDVSVIVVSWNTRQLLRDCVRSVLDHTHRVTFEIIVVDNSSCDGSPEMVAGEFPGVRLIRNAENRGFPVANNQGIAVARGRYVLLLNSDARVLDGAIDKTIAFADAHPEAAVVGCRVVWPDGSQQHTCMMFPSLLNLLLSLTRLQQMFRRNRFFGRQRLTWWDYGAPRVVDAVAGCFMLVRREALEQAGPLAEDYFMYSEDTEWCWRFRQHGWKTMYTPDGTIVHVGGASSSQCAQETHVMLRRSLLMFIEKTSGRWTRRLANLMFCVASLIRLPILAFCRLCGGDLGAKARRQWPLSVAALRFHALGLAPGRPTTCRDAKS